MSSHRDEIFVLVDYQPKFGASHDETTTIAVLRELCAAMERRAPVVVVEFKGYGPSHQRVKDVLEGYDKLLVVEKTGSDGAFEVVSACRSRGFIADDFDIRPARYRRSASSADAADAPALPGFRVFGVDADICVFRTTRSLSTEYGARVTVVKSACNWCPPVKDPWERYAALPGVDLVA